MPRPYPTMHAPTGRPGSIRTASRGQTMVEYALLLSAIALLAFVAARTMGQNAKTALNNSSAKMSYGSSVTAGGGGTTIPGDS